MKALWWTIAWVGLVGIERAWAVDQSYSKALKHIEIKSSGRTGTTGEYIVPVLLAVGAIVLIIALYRRFEERRRAHKAEPAAVHEGPDFREQAAKMGFQRAEVRLLKLVAEKIAPHTAARLLESDAGRLKLASAVNKRMRRRERELLVLRSLSGKLGAVGHMQERETVRVEAHLPVWIAPQLTVEEDEWEEVEQFEGELLDLSEGGAALRADLPLGEGDPLEFWSADANIWLAPTAAQVLRVVGEGGRRVFHLRFMDPPGDDLRAAIRALQMEAAHERGEVNT